MLNEFTVKKHGSKEATKAVYYNVFSFTENFTGKDTHQN